jgi:anti-sigma factor RsiW
MGGELKACERWKAKLEVYLDGALTGEEMRAFDTHVRSCPSCAADALAQVQMKRSVQAAGKRFTPSEALRRKIQRAVAVQSSRRTPGWQWATGLALAGLLLGTALSLSYFGKSHSNEEAMQSEMADLHVAALASSAPVDVVSTDRHTVKPWFQGKIPFTFNLPELQNSDFSLLGGRVTYVEQSPGAHLIYQVRKHLISVVILQEKPVQDHDGNGARMKSPGAKAYSFNTETWSQDGLRYFVIGDASEDDIHRLAELLKDAART